MRDSFQVEENEDYAMGVPLKSINLGVEQPKPGDVAITAAHRAKRGIFNNIWDALVVCKFTLTFIFFHLQKGCSLKFLSSVSFPKPENILKLSEMNPMKSD